MRSTVFLASWSISVPLRWPILPERIIGNRPASRQARLGSDPPHPIELRPAVSDILQRGTERGRLVIHAERHIGRVLPKLLLHLSADLLLLLAVRRIEPRSSQGLHLRVGRPAEPRIRAACADRNVGPGRYVPHAAEIGVENVPPAFVDGLAARATGNDA